MFEFLNKITEPVKSLFDPAKRILKESEPKVQEIRAKINEYEEKPKDELLRIIDNYKKELEEINERIPDEERNTIKMRRKTETLHPAELELYNRIQEITAEVYAIFWLVAKDVYKIELFDVQLLAASVLATGQKLVEMKTGEGKTNTFQLPLFLYGLTGRGAHLVTVNDYLAKRDGEYAGHLFSKFGLTVGIITPDASYKFIPDEDLKEEKGTEEYEKRKKVIAQEKKGKMKISAMEGFNLKECSKKETYECDIVYGTNNEFGFDYLRDNMAKSLNRRVQRELYFCIVDEADSILIDEARTPLIISAPAAQSNDLYRQFAHIADKLSAENHYVVEEKDKSVNLTDEGIEKIEKMLKVSNVWEDYRLAHHLENALKAKAFFNKDKEYLVKDNKVMIVDEFTGRVLEGRRYSEGLHQAIEAKEGVEIQKESRTLATITFQNFFRLYKILTGGSGTIMTEQEEFFKIYNLESTAIPTNLPMIRQDLPDRIYKNTSVKFTEVVKEIQRIHKTGQPILVGTTSIEASELISKKLESLGIDHEVLNAKYHEREAQIVAKAGEQNAVTVATNMAGRGTDIPLGEGVVDLGGLYVIGTERHESRRIDNQLRGRSGRQGDPGTSRFFVALDDQIMRIQGGDIVQRILEMTNLPEDMPLESRMITGAIERAQKRMEGMYFDSRKHVVEYDDVINQQREIFYTRRLRFLKLADQENPDTDEIKQLIIEEFDSTISKKVAELTETPDKIKANPNETVDMLLSLGDDEVFIAAANELKLFKSEIKSPEELKEILKKHILKIVDTDLSLSEFLGNYLKTTLKLKLDSIDNYSVLIKVIFLNVMDELWTLHLDHMQDIREGIGLRSVAQKDPLVEYKNEGFAAFTRFMDNLSERAFTSLMQIKQVSSSGDTKDKGTSGSSLLGQPDAEISTNVNEIEDILQGDREIVRNLINKVNQEKAAGSESSKTKVKNSTSKKGKKSKRKLSRRQRRALEREAKKKDD